MRAAAADHPRTGHHRDRLGVVGGGVVGDPDRGIGKGPAQGGEGLADPVGLVAGRDEDGEAVRHGGYCPAHERGASKRHDLPLRAASEARRFVMADIEAHITGNVWKIEVAVGDTVEDGDTVVILESMKMEIPVEAEDEGTVKEIRCEEGQSVSEGDVLVVLE